MSVIPLASVTLFTLSECQTTLLCSVKEDPCHIVNETPHNTSGLIQKLR